jgi:LuxR family quorum sensing-dependent transcriptional regulator
MDREQYKFAFDAIAAIERAAKPSVLLAEVTKIAKHFGLPTFAITTIPVRSEDFRQAHFAERWPAGWFEHYDRRNFVKSDPVLVQTRKSLKPFPWHQAPLDPDPDSLGRAVMNEATEFGLKDGFTVPFHTPDRQVGCVTFGGERFELSLDEQRALHLIAIYAAAKIHDLLGPREAIPRLSPREIEVLKWCSAGKTTRDIADILSLSESTVEGYVINACQKLDAVTRTQAVAEAIRAGLIP